VRALLHSHSGASSTQDTSRMLIRMDHASPSREPSWHPDDHEHLSLSLGTGVDDETPPARPIVQWSLGDIEVTSTLVVTPSGVCALAGSRWVLRDLDVDQPHWSLRVVARLPDRFRILQRPRPNAAVEVTFEGHGVRHVSRIVTSDSVSRETLVELTAVLNARSIDLESSLRLPRAFHRKETL
jgi:hypothetical protein